MRRGLRHHRSISTAAAPPAPAVHVYRLLGTDVFLNLAAEDWIFRTTDLRTTSVLLLWRNATAVVIGRNQHPWLECDVDELARRRIPFARRLSGGGTVYHDLGNTNFTIITDRTRYNTAANSQLVVRTLARLGVAASVSGRNDILVDGHKVSGAAYKLTASRAYHHATMLLRADRALLSALLRPSRAASEITSLGVASVRSPITNLGDARPALTHESFCDALADEFVAAHGGNVAVNTHISDMAIAGLAEVERTCEQLQSWDWRFGQTPKFWHAIGGYWNGLPLKVRIECERGRVTDVHAVEGIEGARLAALHEALLNAQYGRAELEAAVQTRCSWPAAEREALAALLRKHIPFAL